MDVSFLVYLSFVFFYDYYIMIIAGFLLHLQHMLKRNDYQ
jgi:hypothetical protein